MNKRILLSIIAVLPFLAFAQQSFTIKGNFSKAPTAGKAYLIYGVEEQMHIDSTVVTDGGFTFTGKVDKPTKATLAVDYSGVGLREIPYPDFISIYLENGGIAIKGTDLISTATLTGTPLNLDQDKLNKASAQVAAKEKEFMLNYLAASEVERKSEGFMEGMNTRHELIQNDKKEVLLAFIKSNPNSIVSLNSIKDYAERTSDANSIELLISSLSPEMQEREEAKGLKKRLIAAKYAAAKPVTPEVGTIAPDFTQNDPDGNPVSLSSFKGKYVLIDFWASWCGPCRQENPNLVAAYNKFKDKNFTILGVSLDRETGRDAWLKAIESDQLAWTQVSDLKFWSNEVAELYGVRSIPQSYLIDPTGKIIGKNLRGEELHKVLTEIMN